MRVNQITRITSDFKMDIINHSILQQMIILSMFILSLCTGSALRSLKAYSQI